MASFRQLQREWENGQDVLESTNGHELLNINGLSNNAYGPKVQGFQSTSEGSTFLVPSEAKGEFCLLLLLDISSLHQKYVNTCTLNGDGDSFGVTDHKAKERLVSTAEKTSAGSIQNCENAYVRGKISFRS